MYFMYITYIQSMTMITLTYVQVRNGLAEALNRVCYGGERILIARRGKSVAALVSVDDLEMLQCIADTADRLDARKAPAAHKRHPQSAIPLERPMAEAQKRLKLAPTRKKTRQNH